MGNCIGFFKHGNTQPVDRQIETTQNRAEEVERLQPGTFTPMLRTHNFGHLRQQKAPISRLTQISAVSVQSSPLSQPDPIVQLTDYLVRRAAINKPVSDDIVKKLYDAHKTVVDTRAALSYGRGNVTVDCEKTDYESAVRAWLVREFIEDSVETTTFISLEKECAIRAAAAKFAKAGHCGEFSFLAVCLHASKLKHDEYLKIVNAENENIVHQWVELHPPHRNKQENSGEFIVIDGWADGPAILSDDSEYVNRTFLLKYPEYIVNAKKAPCLLEHFRDQINKWEKNDRNVADKFHIRLQKHRNDQSLREGNSAPVSVFKNAFIEQSDNALKMMPSGPLNDLKAQIQKQIQSSS